jgi:hypothetical protein
VWICAALVAGSLALPAVTPARMTGYEGRFIAFERDGDLYAVSEDGQSEFQLTQTAAREGHPSWATPTVDCQTDASGTRPVEPDGRRIVYESASPGGPGDILEATVSGSGASGGPLSLAALSAVTATADLDEGDPAVGVVTPAPPAVLVPVPAVAFTRAGADHQRHIFVKTVDAPASDLGTQVTSGPDDANPDWAGDGTSIAYDRLMADGTRQIAIVDMTYDGAFHPADPRPVTTGPLTHTDPSRFDYAFDDDANDQTPKATSPSRMIYTTRYADLGLDYLDYLEHDADRLTAGALFSPAAIPAPQLVGLTGDPGGDSAPSQQLPPALLTPGGGATFQSTRDAPGNIDVYRVAADGSGVTRLTSNPQPDLDPDWEAITQADGGQCLEPLPDSPDPGSTPARHGRPQPSADPTGSSSASGAAAATGKPSAPRPMSLRRVQVKASGKGRRRALVVSFIVDRRASARLRLMRRHRVLARRSYQLHAGANRLRLAVPRKIKPGRYQLTITVRSAPFTRTVARTVRLRR